MRYESDALIPKNTGFQRWWMLQGGAGCRTRKLHGVQGVPSSNLGAPTIIIIKYLSDLYHLNYGKELRLQGPLRGPIGCFASAEPPSPEKPGWLLDEKPPVRFTIGASGSGGVSAEQARSSPSAGPVWLLLLPMNPNQHSWRGFGTFESLRDCERHISEEMPAALPADEQGRHYFYITDKDGNKVLSSMWFECRRGG